MNVLIITGDTKFGPGHERYELQRSVVESLAVVYWGRGSLWPTIPAGHFDVVTVQDPFWRGLFGWWVAKHKGARFNVQVHTDLSVYTGLHNVLAQIMLRHADSIRVVSEKIRQQVLKVAPQAKVTVLPVFVDIRRFRVVTPELHGKKTVLWIGRFEEEKDPLLAIEIVSRIPDTKLIMLGKGSLEHKLRDKAAGLPVEFPGWVDPVRYLPTADVVLCTSKHESYGASIVESLAAGVPVVAPDVGVASEAGAIVVPREQLADAVVRVLREGPKGELLLTMPAKEAWAQQWQKTL